MIRYECPTCDVVVQPEPGRHYALCKVCGVKLSTSSRTDLPRARKHPVEPPPPSGFWRVVLGVLSLLE